MNNSVVQSVYTYVLPVSYYAFMSAVAIAVANQYGDFNTKFLVMIAYCVLVISFMITSIIDIDEESRAVVGMRFLKFGKFLISCAFVSALLAMLRTQL